MKKAQSLYGYILDCCPELKRDPSRVEMTVRNGNLVARHGANLGFEQKYRLSVTVLGLTGHIFSILLPIAVWIRAHQVELMLNHEKAEDAVSFEVDILDRQTYDLAVEIPLTESVDVLMVDGVYRMTERDEPPIAGTESAEGLALLPDDVILLMNVYGELLLNRSGANLTPPAT